MISVILSIYNGEKFIGDTIKSILQQTYTDFELIIVNDGSTDHSEEVISTFKDDRIHYVKQENKGTASAKNTGLRLAKGDFITFHDSDDISLPNRFERLLEAFFSEKIGLTHSDMLLMDENDSPFSYWGSSNILPNQIFSFFLHVGTPFNNPTILYRKETLENLSFDEKLKNTGEDTDLVLKITRKWPSYHIPEPLYLYRRHQTNVTNKISPEEFALHIKKNITNEELHHIKELNWDSNPLEHTILKAKLIAGVALSRRWMISEAIKLFNEARPYLKNQSDWDLYEGMKGILDRNYEMAIKHFEKIIEQDHIVENYLGEAYLYLKKYDKAFSHFMKALELNPHYPSPVQNLKSIGILKGYNNVDKYVNKFR